MKAVLVMDMPSCCDECPVMDLCEVEANDTCRAGGCPLKPLPEKKPYKGEEAITSFRMEKRIKEALQEMFNLGFNDCLDEIGGNAK